MTTQRYKSVEVVAMLKAKYGGCVYLVVIPVSVVNGFGSFR